MEDLTIFTKYDITYLEGNTRAVFLNYILVPDVNKQVLPMQKFHPKMMIQAQELKLTDKFTEIEKKKILTSLVDLKDGDYFLCVSGLVHDEDAKKYYLRMIELMNTGVAKDANEAQKLTREEFLGTEFVNAMS